MTRDDEGGAARIETPITHEPIIGRLANKPGFAGMPVLRDRDQETFVLPMVP